MRSIVMASVITICGLTGSAAIAAQRPALCKLVVKGKTYINGWCNFEDFGDGSFAIGVLEMINESQSEGFISLTSMCMETRRRPSGTRIEEIHMLTRLWERSLATVHAGRTPSHKFARGDLLRWRRGA